MPIVTGRVVKQLTMVTKNGCKLHAERTSSSHDGVHYRVGFDEEGVDDGDYYEYSREDCLEAAEFFSMLASELSDHSIMREEKTDKDGDRQPELPLHTPDEWSAI